MNQNIFDPLSPSRIFLDTTVLCGALRTNGINQKILELAASPVFFKPVLDNNPAVNSLVGRESFEVVVRNRRPIGEVLAELSGCTNEEVRRIVSQQQMLEPLHNFDENDFHVWFTAIIEKCNYIMTNNTKRFPEKIGDITIIKPGEFYNIIMD